MTFFSLGTESIIAGVLITSLAKCTEYPGSLGFLKQRSLMFIYLQSHFHELVPVRLPSLSGPCVGLFFGNAKGKNTFLYDVRALTPEQSRTQSERGPKLTLYQQQQE